jgi:hypothetical protein
MTDAGQQARPRTRWSVVVPLARRAVRYELAMWRSLYRWTLRRPRAGKDAETFGYAAAAAPLYWTFIVLSAIEVVVVDLILPWQSVRRIALALGVYGLFWMVGALANLRVHPHVASPAGLRIRQGSTVDVALPWAAVAGASARIRPLPSRRAIQLASTRAGTALHVAMLSQTTVDITLREPTTVELPHGRRELVTEVRCYADDARGLVARIREQAAAQAR